MQLEPTAPRRRRQKDRIERVCETDGVVFSVTASQLRNSPCRWHTRACWRKSLRTGEERTCALPTCSKTFYVGGSALNHRPSEFCSTECARIAQRRGELRKCRARGCPKTSYVQRGHLRKSPGNGWYCSPKCKGERVRELKYRGGPFRMYGSNWDAQRRLARKRDGYTCQDCGQRQGKLKLDVHHLKSRRSFGRDYISANRLENLITLCRPCHVKWELAITHSGVRLMFEEPLRQLVLQF
jgi:5-methylcytosine-specific restriction endonuclease McrA